MSKRRSMIMLLVVALITLVVIATGCEQEATDAPAGDSMAGRGNNGEEVSMESMIEKVQDTNEFTFDYLVTHHEDDHVFSGTMEVQDNKQRIIMEELGDFEDGKYAGFKDQFIEYIIDKGAVTVLNPNQLTRGIEYIIDKEEQEFIIYIPGQKVAIISQVPEGLVVDNPQEQTEKVNEKDAAEAEDLGTQEIDGVECRGWRISYYGEENATAEMWLHKEHGLPIKIEVFENDELIMTVEYKNLTVGDIPTDTFEIPEDVEMLDIRT